MATKALASASFRQHGYLQGGAMIKRLRSVSGSGDQEPPARRRRYSDGLKGQNGALSVRPETSFDTLPLEIRTSIIENIVDERDTVGTLKTLTNLSRAGSRTRAAVDLQLGPKTLGNMSSFLSEITDDLDHFPMEPRANEYTADMRAFLRTEAAVLPLQSAQGRRHNVMAILRYKNTDFDCEAVRNVIDNLGYLEPDLRTKVVEHVSKNLPEYGMADGLVSDLVREAEALAPGDRDVVLAATMDISDPNTRMSALEQWAGTAHLLDDSQQHKILNDVLEFGNCGEVLASFAEHADKLTTSTRSSLADAVVVLDHNDRYRSQALSHLARHIDILGDQRSNVATSVLSDLDRFPAFADTAQESWYTHPGFCNIEALRYLSNSHKLASAEKAAVRAAIEQKLNSLPGLGDVHADGVCAQLIDYLPEKRLLAFNAATYSNSQLSDGIVGGLAARLDTLSSVQRGFYIQKLYGMPLSRGIGNQATRYAIQNKLDICTKRERSMLIGRQIDVIISHEDPSYAGLALADITANARHLARQDIHVTVNAALRLARTHMNEFPISPEVDKSIRSCAGHAARCVSTWASETLARPSRDLLNSRSRESTGISR